MEYLSTIVEYMMSKKPEIIEPSIESRFQGIRQLLTNPQINIIGSHEHFNNNGAVEYPLHRIKINGINGESFKINILDDLDSIKACIKKNQTLLHHKEYKKSLGILISKCTLVLENIEQNYPFGEELGYSYYSNSEPEPDPGYSIEDMQYYSGLGLPMPGKFVETPYKIDVIIYKPFFGHFLRMWFNEILTKLENLCRVVSRTKWPIKDKINIKILCEKLASSGLCSNTAQELELIINGQSLNNINWVTGKNGAAPVSSIVHFVKSIIDPTVKPDETFDIIYNTIHVAGKNLNKTSIKATISKRLLTLPIFFNRAIDGILMHL